MLVSWQLLVVIIRVLPGGPPQLPQIPRADSGPRICYRLGPDGDREKCQHPEDRDRCDQVDAVRHSGEANYLFADGHVSLMSWSSGVKPKLTAAGSKFVHPSGGNPALANK